MQVKRSDYSHTQAVRRCLKKQQAAVPSNVAARLAESLFIVFNHHLVLPEYVVEYELVRSVFLFTVMPMVVPADHSCVDSISDARTRTSPALSTSHSASGLPNEMTQLSTIAKFPCRLAIQVPNQDAPGNRQPVHAHRLHGANRAEQQLQQKMPEIAYLLRGLSPFLAFANVAGGDVKNPALQPLPEAIQDHATAALALPPQVSSTWNRLHVQC